MRMPVEVRMITAADDFLAIENLQKMAWEMGDETTVPSHVLQACCKYDAGFLAGAFFEGKIIGFVLAFKTEDQNVYYSHMMGIEPAWQKGKNGFSVAMLLKDFQKKEILRKGADSIVWTFDPLLSVNANLNFHKLRVDVIRYEPDAYGETSEVGIYAGMPTDRVLVRWFLKGSKRVLSVKDAINTYLISSPDEIEGSYFRVEIPLDIQKLKEEDIDSARAARLKLREIFLEALKRGYNVEDFICLKEEEKNYYVFSEDDSSPC